MHLAKLTMRALAVAPAAAAARITLANMLAPRQTPTCGDLVLNCTSGACGNGCTCAEFEGLSGAGLCIDSACFSQNCTATTDCCLGFICADDPNNAEKQTCIASSCFALACLPGSTCCDGFQCTQTIVGSYCIPKKV